MLWCINFYRDVIIIINCNQWLSAVLLMVISFNISNLILCELYQIWRSSLGQRLVNSITAKIQEKSTSIDVRTWMHGPSPPDYIEGLYEWFCSNRLSLNPVIPKYIVPRPRHTKQNFSEYFIQIGNTVLSRIGNECTEISWFASRWESHLEITYKWNK